MIRVGHFSDLHYCAKNLEEADRCFGFAVDEAIRRGIQVAVISGDATDHALEMHNPAVERLERQVVKLAEHCPVLMLQGTFSHEPPGTLATFAMLRGRYAIHVAQRISQVALLADGAWSVSQGWRFDDVPDGAHALFTCVPTVNKASIAAVVGAAEAAVAQGHELAALLAGYAGINDQARERSVPTIGVSHGTVTGCITEHGVPMAGFDHEFTTGALFAAGAQAVLLGHIHRHQSWVQDGPAGRQCIAYPGSIGRFHHGEQGDKGFLLWDIDAHQADCALEATPARRTVDIVFEGKPEPSALRAAIARESLDGAHVRVRWTVTDEERQQVDRTAMARALQAEGAVDIQMEGRVIPMVRTRAAGISQLASLADKVRTWAEITNARPEPLLDCLARLGQATPEAIVQGALATESQRPAFGDGTRFSLAVDFDPTLPD